MWLLKRSRLGLEIYARFRKTALWLTWVFAQIG